MEGRGWVWKLRETERRKKGSGKREEIERRGGERRRRRGEGSIGIERGKREGHGQMVLEWKGGRGGKIFWIEGLGRDYEKGEMGGGGTGTGQSWKA